MLQNNKKVPESQPVDFFGHFFVIDRKKSTCHNRQVLTAFTNHVLAKRVILHTKRKLYVHFIISFSTYNSFLKNEAVSCLIVEKERL